MCANIRSVSSRVRCFFETIVSRFKRITDREIGYVTRAIELTAFTLIIAAVGLGSLYLVALLACVALIIGIVCLGVVLMLCATILTGVIYGLLIVLVGLSAMLSFIINRPGATILCMACIGAIAAVAWRTGTKK